MKPTGKFSTERICKLRKDLKDLQDLGLSSGTALGYVKNYGVNPCSRQAYNRFLGGVYERLRDDIMVVLEQYVLNMKDKFKAFIGV